MKTKLTDILPIDYPIIMAPMFLITNVEMIVASLESGITGCIPALNFRTTEELAKALKEIKARSKKPFGVNLIVNKSNVHYKKQLHTCLDNGVDYFITSLGSPEETIRESKKNGTKVFCDVIDELYARKVEGLGADGVIAVNSGAGGHLGNIPATVLVPMLKKACKVPVISAGGIGSGAGIIAMLALGADGVSIGSPFIATNEAPISDEYKKACVEFGAEDIVMTDKISGSRCTAINTPYLKKIGINQNFVESFLNSNKQVKKYAKMLTYYRGMKLLEKAAFGASYKSVWVAGTSIEFTEKIEPLKDIVARYVKEMDETRKLL
ncbi:MAG: nitronate monooxygenase [Bdellovibrionota bacterium]